MTFMRLLFNYIVLISLTFVFSCESPVDRDVKGLMNREIYLPYDKMVKRICSLYTDTTSGQKPFLLLNYIDMDSIECSQCRLAAMENVESFIEKEAYECVDVIYIIHSAPHLMESSYRKICNARLKGIAYFDTTGVFLKNNLNFPQKGIFHTLLLDKNRKIVMLGSPCLNDKMRALFRRIVEVDDSRKDD